MPQPPAVLAMILCDQIITDVDSNKKTLIGLFDQVETASLPCMLHELHVYLSLTDGHGTLSTAIACVTVDEGEELFRGEAEVEFADPLQVVATQGNLAPEEAKAYVARMAKTGRYQRDVY